ncbi:MAG TPA: hypothetical protein VNT03_01735 [Baekduia sp.]|nr:hypothetical protein [Baekduia sp.]
MRGSFPTFDQTALVAEIKAGYYRFEMAGRPDDTSTFALKHHQDGRARDEDRHAREAERPAEERAHRRRADKAAYLRDKLDEAERAERAAKQ